MQLIHGIAELAWLPELAESAIGLDWADAGAEAFSSSGRAGEREVSVRFAVDGEGDVTDAHPIDVLEGC